MATVATAPARTEQGPRPVDDGAQYTCHNRAI